MTKVKKSIFLNKINLFALAIGILVSCKSKKVDISKPLNSTASAPQVFAMHKAKNFEFNTLQSKIKANYNDGKRSVSPSITLRMEKDKQILLSVKFFGITAAKIYMTPTRLSFYEKIKRRYYDGDFKTLSQMLGTEVSFTEVQNILLGQSIIDLNPKKLKSKWKAPNHIEVTPSKQNEKFDMKMLFHILSAKVSEYQIEKNQNSLKINYPSYQKVENQNFPESLILVAKQPKRTRTIQLNFKNVELNQKMSFPYSIPSGYNKFKR